MCSSLITSTVLLNAGASGASLAGVKLNELDNEGGDPDLDVGFMTGDWTSEGGLEDLSRRYPRLEEKGNMGVEVPVGPSGVEGLAIVLGVEGRCRASEAARRRRLVVPRAFVDPERAEQTIASLCWSRYELFAMKRTKQRSAITST